MVISGLSRPFPTMITMRAGTAPVLRTMRTVKARAAAVWRTMRPVHTPLSWMAPCAASVWTLCHQCNVWLGANPGLILTGDVCHCSTVHYQTWGHNGTTPVVVLCCPASPLSLFLHRLAGTHHPCDGLAPGGLQDELPLGHHFA
jgi:hypothetical protein